MEKKIEIPICLNCRIILFKYLKTYLNNYDAILDNHGLESEIWKNNKDFYNYTCPHCYGTSEKDSTIILKEFTFSKYKKYFSKWEKAQKENKKFSEYGIELNDV